MIRPNFDRIRTRTDIYEPTTWLGRCGVGFTPFLGRVPRRIERFEDWDSPAVTASSGRLKPKSCYHTKTLYVPMTSEVIGAEWIPYGYKWYNIHPHISDDQLGQMLAWKPPLYMVDEEDWVRSALDRFNDQFPAEVDLGNFLAEWSDITTVVPKLERSLARTAGGNYLNWSFGVSPTIADLEALLSIVQRVLDRIQWLKDHNGKVSRLRTKREYDHTPAVKPVVALGNPAWALRWPDMSFRARLKSYKVAFKAQASLAMDVDIPDNLEAVARGLLAALGLNNPLGTIWNGLPGSFLIDWVFPFSSVLNRTKLKTFRGRYEATDFEYSFEHKYVWDVEFSYKLLWADELCTGISAWKKRRDAVATVGQISHSVYSRDANFSWGFYPPLSFPPSAGQALLLGALLAR